MPARRRTVSRTLAIGLVALAVILVAARAVRSQRIHHREIALAGMNLAALETARAAGEDDARLLLRLGVRQREHGDLALSVATLEQAARRDPDDPDVCTALAASLVQEGNGPRALTGMQEFANAHPGSETVLASLGELQASGLHDLKAAERSLTAALKLDPRDAEALFCIAGVEDGLHEPAIAQNSARRAIAVRPAESRYHLLLASLLARDPLKSEEAGAEYGASIRLAPSESRPHLEYARWLVTSRHGADAYRRAAEEANKAITLGDVSPAASFVLGRAERAAGHLEAAIGPLKKSASLAPDDPAPALELYQVFRSLNRSADATLWQASYFARQKFTLQRNALTQRAGDFPNSTAPRMELAKLLCAHGDVRGCVSGYAAALNQPPSSPAVLASAIRDLVQTRQPLRAVPLAEYLAGRPGAPSAALEMLGDVYAAAGRLSDAGRAFQECLRADPARRSILQRKMRSLTAGR